MQANILNQITPQLSEDELEIVRRARNLKTSVARRSDQAAYRRATAFEALLGYLYLTDGTRLRDVLALTLKEISEEMPESKKNNP